MWQQTEAISEDNKLWFGIWWWQGECQACSGLWHQENQHTKKQGKWTEEDINICDWERGDEEKWKENASAALLQPINWRQLLLHLSPVRIGCQQSLVQMYIPDLSRNPRPILQNLFEAVLWWGYWNCAEMSYLEVPALPWLLQVLHLH